MKQLLNIWRFELFSLIKNKSFIIMTSIFVFLIVVLMFLPTILGLFNNDKKIINENGETVIVSDDNTEKESEILYCLDLTANGTLYDYIQPSFPQFDVKKTNLEQIELEKLIKDGKNIKGAIILHEDSNFSYVTQSYGMYDVIHSQLNEIIKLKYQTELLQKQGMNEQQIAGIINPFISSALVETGKSTMNNFMYTYILVYLLFIAIMLYGQMVTMSVANEKSSRAMELLITSVNTTSLMFGKVFAAVSAGILQMGAIFVSGIVFFKINEASWKDMTGELGEVLFSMIKIPPEIIVFTLIFFILGFFVYAFLFAALGSMVSRMEDIQTSTMPILLLFMASFFVSFYGMMADANSTLIKVASFVPFSSPMSMFIRICLSEVSIIEIAISLAILVGTIGIIGWASAKIYRVGVLMYGQKPKIGELVKILKRQ